MDAATLLEEGCLEHVVQWLDAGGDVNARMFDGCEWTRPLHVAVEHGHGEVAAFLVRERGADVNAAGPRGLSALAVAAKEGDAEMVRLLAALGADVNGDPSTNGWVGTALHVAAAGGKTVAAAALIELGARCNVADAHRHTPLHRASEAGSEGVVDVLLRAGASVASQDMEGNTPLHVAARDGCAAVAARLLRGGANANATNAMRDSPLHVACLLGHLAVVEVLLDAGAVTSAPNTAGSTPLMEASAWGNAEVAELVLGRGADVNQSTAIGGAALHQAAKRDNAEMVTLLVRRGADPNLVVGSTRQETPLVAAASSCAHRAMRALMACGADPRQRLPATGDAPLHVLARHSWGKLYDVDDGFLESDVVECVSALLDAGADPLAANAIGDTPLHIAASQGLDFLIERMLARLGPARTPSAVNHLARTPLHCACAPAEVMYVPPIIVQEHHRAVVGMLAEAGAPLDARDACGETALHRAARHWFQGGVEELAGHGAAALPDRWGRTPLHVAANRVMPRTAAALVAGGGCAASTDSAGRTPLDEALRHVRAAACGLRAASADVQARAGARSTGRVGRGSGPSLDMVYGNWVHREDLRAEELPRSAELLDGEELDTASVAELEGTHEQARRVLVSMRWDEGGFLRGAVCTAWVLLPSAAWGKRRAAVVAGALGFWWWG